MAGIVPRRKIKGVDICGSSSHYIIRSDLGCYMRAKDFNKGSDLSIHALHPDYQHGDHYFADFADKIDQFYIIKGDKYHTVTDLTAGTDSAVFTLHPMCQGGDHYLSAFGWFYIIFQKKGIYKRTADLSKDSHSKEFPLHPNCKDALYYWGDLDHCYFLKPALDWRVQYYKGTNLNSDKVTDVLSVHPNVLNFLPGGLSINKGPAFCKWVKIKTVSNDSPTPKTWRDKITKKVGYNKKKMSQITHNWKIAASVKITAGALAALIANAEFTLSGVYERSRVKPKTENWTEETKVEAQLSRELKPKECLYVWQYQLGLGSEPVLFCKDLKITVPALIMKEADTLCKSLFRWLENRKKCAGGLEKLAQELEDVHQGRPIGTSVDTIYVGAAFISVFKDLASEKEGVSTFDKAAELIKKDEKAGTSIQEQLRDLKDRCAEALLRAHTDELDCEVTTQLMCALAKSHMKPGGTAPVEVSDFIFQALRLDHSSEITESLKELATEMMKDIELIGIKAAEAGSEGATGLGIIQCDLLVKSKEIANRSGITEASEFLRDSARKILEGQQKLKEQHEIIQKLFIMKNLIKDLGGYSFFIDENGQNIMDYIKRTCTDSTVLSWLKGFPHQIQFVNLLRFFLERLGPIPEDLTKPVGGHIDIVFVSHGGIVDQFMPSGVLVPTDKITDTILYSPWNCRIDPNAAFAIAQGSIKPADRAFFNIAHCQPIPLPDHWNSMRRSHQARHNIPVILLSPVTPKDGAWRLFDQLMKTRGLVREDRVIIPYLVPEDEVKAYGEIPLYMFIFLMSFLLMLHGKSATVHLAACLSRKLCVRQYAYTRDGMCMTVRIDEQDMKSELYRALKSLFDTNRR